MQKLNLLWHSFSFNVELQLPPTSPTRVPRIPDSKEIVFLDCHRRVYTRILRSDSTTSSTTSSTTATACTSSASDRRVPGGHVALLSKYVPSMSLTV
jgi:hypothetical protein